MFSNKFLEYVESLSFLNQLEFTGHSEILYVILNLKKLNTNLFLSLNFPSQSPPQKPPQTGD